MLPVSPKWCVKSVRPCGIIVLSAHHGQANEVSCARTKLAARPDFLKFIWITRHADNLAAEKRFKVV